MAKLTKEELNARNWLKEQGVTEYELERLYDANYKARNRSMELTGSIPNNLNLKWENIKTGAQRSGLSVKQYVQYRNQLYKQTAKTSRVREQIYEEIFGSELDEETGEILIESHSNWIEYCLSRYTTKEIADAKKAVLIDEDEDDFASETYARARELYDAGGHSSQEEFDNDLAQAEAEYLANSEVDLYEVLEELGIDGEAIEDAEEEAEEIIEEMRDEERAESTIKRKYNKLRREAMHKYGGSKW